MTAARAAVILAIVGTGGGAGCASSFDASTTAGAAKSINAFGFALYEQVASQHQDVVCSPAGASIALTMTSAGARGETQAQMLKVLRLDPTKMDATHLSFAALQAELKARDGDDVALSVVNRLWGQTGLQFRPPFLSLLDDRYHAPLERLDFLNAASEATKTINRWASDQTHGKIVDPVPPGALTRQTRLVLTNAIYLKARWQVPFNPGATQEMPFHTTTAAGDIPVNMMARTDTIAYAHGHGAQVVELPYKGDLSLVVIVPNAIDGLAAVERKAADSYDGWIAALKPTLVDLQLPRWTTTSTLSLSDDLSRMGMPLPFDQHNADFWDIADPADILKFPGGSHLSIDVVLQKAFIETKEAGTEAAAVTVVSVSQEESELIGPAPPKPIVVHTDHPFLYVIRDRKTGAILFMGRVTSPSAAVSSPDA